MLNKKIIKNLLYVQKPARYTGGEFGIPKKNFENANIRFALVFPEIYEIGMSNVAIKILYSSLNSAPDISCERVFHPWPDFEDVLKENDIPLFSLETFTPVKDFDIVGFTIPYEILFTNALNILKLSDIPLRRNQRNEDHPIILAAGNGITNPEPILPFFDALFFGDGDKITIEIARAIKKHKFKKDKLLELSKIPGIYIPDLHNGPINRYIEKDLDDIEGIQNFPVPTIQAVQDRVAIEISRGCSRGCRFCQAGYLYRPVRERSINNIMNSTISMINTTGYDEISLISLSASDYSKLPELLHELDAYFTPKNISIALPSLRIDSFTDETALKISRVRKSGLTFAVEAGSQFIRNVINKGISEEQLFEVASYAKERGWNLIKLYFMLGLYGDEEELLISDLIERLLETNKRLSLNVSVGVFVPKPLTPFEKNEQMTSEVAWEKIKWLRDKYKRNRKVKIKYQTPEMSEVEGYLSRADGRMADVLEYLVEKGNKLDAWTEFFDYTTWVDALKKFQLNKDELLGKRKETPWRNFQNFISEDFLTSEKEKSEKEIITDDCRKKCPSCGICSNEVKHVYSKEEEININHEPEMEIDKSVQNYLICNFKKENIFFGHRDLMTLFARTIRRSKIPAVYTEGFNPRPRMQIQGSLPLGISSDNEYFILKIYGNPDLEKTIEALNSALPSGITITYAILHKNKLHDLQNLLNYSTYEVSEVDDIEKFKLFLEGDMLVTKKEKEFSIKGYIQDVKYSENTIFLGLDHEAKVGIREIMNAVYGDWRNCFIKRISLMNKKGKKIRNLFQYCEEN